MLVFKQFCTIFKLRCYNIFHSKEVQILLPRTIRQQLVLQKCYIVEAPGSCFMDYLTVLGRIIDNSQSGIFWSFTPSFCFKYFHQGTLHKRDGLVQLTSSLIRLPFQSEFFLSVFTMAKSAVKKSLKCLKVLSCLTKIETIIFLSRCPGKPRQV